MITKRSCVFCGEDIAPGTGKMVVDPSGSVAFYCSSKCEKNVALKRKSRKVKWTSEYRREKGIRVQHLKDAAKQAPKAEKAESPKAEKPAEKAEKTGEKAEKAKKPAKGKVKGKK
jgi:large subunit ribosomal protein L24e